MPLTPPTSPRFGARRAANTDDFNIERDVVGPIDALDLAAKFTSSLSTARPASPVVDQYNYSTDTDVLERWNGSAWVRPTPKPHAASHQDGGTDALTVREAMMATGALGPAKGAFSAYRNAALSLANGNFVTFDAEEFDLSNWFDVTTNPGRFTPQIAGYYEFHWSVATNAAIASSAGWLSWLAKNSTLAKYAGQTVGVAGISSVSHGSAIAQANGTTDFFNIGLSHTVGSATALLTGATGTYFQGKLIGRT